MKKLILAVLLMTTFGASAGQITNEQLAKFNKFNKNWTNIIAVQNRDIVMKIQQHDTLRTCRTVFIKNHKAKIEQYKLSCQDLLDKIKNKKTNETKEVAK
jgi:hypothetical protein